MGKKVRDKAIRQVVDTAWEMSRTCERMSDYYSSIYQNHFSDEHVYTTADLRKMRDQLRRAEKRLNKFVEVYIDQEEESDYT